jgi:hypothetical protein
MYDSILYEGRLIMNNESINDFLFGGDNLKAEEVKLDEIVNHAKEKFNIRYAQDIIIGIKPHEVDGVIYYVFDCFKDDEK